MTALAHKPSKMRWLDEAPRNELRQGAALNGGGEGLRICGAGDEQSWCARVRSDTWLDSSTGVYSNAQEAPHHQRHTKRVLKRFPRNASKRFPKRFLFCCTFGAFFLEVVLFFLEVVPRWVEYPTSSSFSFPFGRSRNLRNLPILNGWQAEAHFTMDF